MKTVVTTDGERYFTLSASDRQTLARAAAILTDCGRITWGAERAARYEAAAHTILDLLAPPEESGE